MHDKTKERIAKLSDQEIADIWLASDDPENPTAEETAALELVKERNIDF